MPREKNKALYETIHPHPSRRITMLKKAIIALVLATGVASLAKLVIAHKAETV